MKNIPPIIQPKKREFPLESKVEKYFHKEILDLGGDSFKFVSINNRGVFDRIAILPTGETFFVEMKAEKGKPSSKQAVFAGKLKAQNQQFCYIYGMIGVNEFIVDIKKGVIIKEIYHEPKRRKLIIHIKTQKYKEFKL